MAADWNSDQAYWPSKQAADFTFHPHDSIISERRIKTVFDSNYCAISSNFLEEQRMDYNKYYSETGNLEDDEVHRFAESVLESDNYVIFDNGYHKLFKIY